MCASFCGPRLFVPGDMKQSMQWEVQKLLLPSTIAAVCNALSLSKAVFNAFVDADYLQLNDKQDGLQESFEIEILELNQELMLPLSTPTQRRAK